MSRVMDGLLGLHNLASHSYLFMDCVECFNIISFYLSFGSFMLFCEISPSCSYLAPELFSSALAFDRFSSVATLGLNLVEWGRKVSMDPRISAPVCRNMIYTALTFVVF